MIEIGDLVKVSTPDDDDGRIGVVTEIGEVPLDPPEPVLRPLGHEAPPYNDILLFGESETKNFLCWEVVKREVR